MAKKKAPAKKSSIKPKELPGGKGPSPEDFVIAWNSSDSAQEVAEKLNWDIGLVHARASKYRKKGVKLKEHNARHGRALDVDRLNKLIDDLGTQDGSKRTSKDAVDEDVVAAVVAKVLEKLKNSGD